MHPTLFIVLAPKNKTIQINERARFLEVMGSNFDQP